MELILILATYHSLVQSPYGLLGVSNPLKPGDFFPIRADRFLIFPRVCGQREPSDLFGPDAEPLNYYFCKLVLVAMGFARLAPDGEWKVAIARRIECLGRRKKDGICRRQVNTNKRNLERTPTATSRT